eukprot:4120348-Prymnesium_polylepis.1
MPARPLLLRQRRSAPTRLGTLQPERRRHSAEHCAKRLKPAPLPSPCKVAAESERVRVAGAVSDSRRSAFAPSSLPWFPEKQTLIVDGGESARVGVAKRLTHSLERLPIERLGLIPLALGLEQLSQVADGGERVGVAVAERTASCERLPKERLGIIQLALVLEQPS